MINDRYMTNWPDLRHHMKKSIAQKNVLLGKMQKSHQEASGEIVNTVFSTNPGIRDELVKKTEKYPITMIDFADIPDSISDDTLLRIIANILDRSAEDEKNTFVGRTNKFLLVDQKDKVVVSPEMLRIIESKVAKAIEKLMKRFAIKIEDINNMKGLFNCDDENDIVFRNQCQLIDFLRKTPIKQSEIKKHTKTKYILIICAVLKEMLREIDFKAQKSYIHALREQLEKFIRVDLVSMLDREGSIDDPIRDLSHTDYFSDKEFLFRRSLLKEKGINYPKDIRIKLAYRSKQDKSIQDKLIIEPTVKTVDVLHDLGGVKYVVLGDEQEKKTAILLYIMFLEYSEREQKFNKHTKVAAPANDDNKAFLPHAKYANDKLVLEAFLNNMSVTGSYQDNKAPLYKDSGLLLLDPESKEGDRKLDEKLYDSLGIIDVRYRHLLQLAVQKKNISFKEKKAEIGRKLDTEKMKIFEESICKPEHKQYSERIWTLIRKYDEIKKKIEKLDSSDHNKKDKEGGGDMNGERLQYQKLANGWNLVNTIKQDCVCAFAQLQTYYSDWLVAWQKHEKEKKLNKHIHVNTSTKGAWKVAKISSNVKLSNDNNISIEHQILGDDQIKSLPNIDEHVIYNPAKQLLVYGRNNSGILSLADIEHIVDAEVLPQFRKYPDKLGEKGITLKQIQEEIEKDTSLLPVGGSFKDKIIYNFVNNRGLKKKGYIYLTPYFYNLHHYNLTPDLPSDK